MRDILELERNVERNYLSVKAVREVIFSIDCIIS